jgi:hypothetical protein
MPVPRPLTRIAAAIRRLAFGPDGLDRCLMCRRAFVCPIDWESDGDAYWLINLRCGQCGVGRRVRVTDAEAEAYDLTLGEHTRRIADELQRLDRKRMRSELDRFVTALAHDLIDAADFAR